MASTMISIGDRIKTSFPHVAWVQGWQPNDIVPIVFATMRKKNKMVKEAIADQTWIKRH
jgi:hypothetical protein